MKLSETIESFLQINYELILSLGFDNDVVNIGFNIAMWLIGEAQLYRTLVGGVAPAFFNPKDMVL